MNMMGRPLSLMSGFTVLYPLLLFAKRNKKRKKESKKATPKAAETRDIQDRRCHSHILVMVLPLQ